MYSYGMAAKAFEENKQRIGDPTNDPDACNLYTGLANLTGAIDGDLSEIKDLLGHISNALSRLR